MIDQLNGFWSNNSFNFMKIHYLGVTGADLAVYLGNPSDALLHVCNTW